MWPKHPFSLSNPRVLRSSGHLLAVIYSSNFPFSDISGSLATLLTLTFPHQKTFQLAGSFQMWSMELGWLKHFLCHNNGRRKTYGTWNFSALDWFSSSSMHLYDQPTWLSWSMIVLGNASIGQINLVLPCSFIPIRSQKGCCGPESAWLWPSTPHEIVFFHVVERFYSLCYSVIPSNIKGERVTILDLHTFCSVPRKLLEPRLSLNWPGAHLRHDHRHEHPSEQTLYWLSQNQSFPVSLQRCVWKTEHIGHSSEGNHF